MELSHNESFWFKRMHDLRTEKPWATGQVRHVIYKLEQQGSKIFRNRCSQR